MAWSVYYNGYVLYALLVLSVLYLLLFYTLFLRWIEISIVIEALSLCRFVVYTSRPHLSLSFNITRALTSADSVGQRFLI